MGKKMSGSNSSGPTKAGKKHQFKEPPRPNAEKAHASRLGEQQFTRNKGQRIGQLPKTLTDEVIDALTAAFNVKRMPRKPFDTGYRYDPTRGRVVVPPGEISNY